MDFKFANLMKAAIVVLVGAGFAAPGSLRAEPAAAIVTVTCPSTGPGFVVCGATGLVLHEFVQMANGKGGFGPNGEIMRILAVPTKIADQNIRAASSERGEAAKFVRGAFGISWEHMRKYGLFGGANSIFRKPFG